MEEQKDKISLSLPENIAQSGIGELKVKEQIPEHVSVKDMLNYIQENVTTWRELQTYYTCAVMEVETKFKVLNQEFSMEYDRNPIESIKSRIKTPESLAEKLIRKRLPLSIESVENNVFDMAGVRVICSFLDDIYMLADSFVRQDDVYMVQQKDYIRTPKPSGYRGLHLVIEIPIFLHNEKRMMKVEVQFRTIAMDFWASLEHKLHYKKKFAPALMTEIGEELEESSRKVYELDRQMQDIRNRIEEAQELQAEE